jgi:hypothetical protein
MYKLFYHLFPDVAERESRSLNLPYGSEDGDLPPGSYLFVEQYCTDPDCDCERVLLSVTEERLGIVATIAYGFNPAKFPEICSDPDLFLDPLNPQSQYAEQILVLFKEIVLDEVYEERLRRHYRMVKAATRTSARSTSRADGGATTRSDQSARQRRKLQKAARRRNRPR